MNLKQRRSRIVIWANRYDVLQLLVMKTKIGVFIVRSVGARKKLYDPQAYCFLAEIESARLKFIPVYHSKG